MSALPARVFRAASNGVWLFSRNINAILPKGGLPCPSWAPGRLLRSWERTQMMTGVPRGILSLCPDCNREAADAVVNGEASVADFRDKPGIIEAEILEEAGRILIRKACERHGPFEDVLSNHPAFFRRMERFAFGRDFNCVGDAEVHNHGANGIETGRGTYLIVDLTNRCNMVCSPCYMDANASSFIHELGMEDVKAIFERAVSFKPQREINVLFSGGEATLSPIFLEAICHAKSMGFHRIHVATNGIRFAQDSDLAVRARAAGLHGVYLQFDGTTEEKNRHRGVGNYMEVKYRALQNIAAAGMRTTLQVSVVNGLNNDGVGDIVRFVSEHIDKIHGVIFQPVMFCGRDEDVPNDERYMRRYPVSQIVYDLEEQTSIGWQPMRDWFPVSVYGAFAHLCDVLNPKARLGSLFNDIHPNHGIFSPILVNAHTREMIPVGAFFNVEQFIRDIVEITDLGRRPAITKSLVLLSVLRNFDQDRAPSEFGVRHIRELLEDCFYRVAGSGEDWSQRAYSYDGPWKLVMVSAMLFQDLFNYDLSTMSDSTTPVATQEGEISFCAYNGGRWRKVVEHLHQTATLTSWHRAHSRHQIYAKGRRVDFRRAPTIASQLVQIESEPKTVSAVRNIFV
jgi:7,8-dihydro-6-hydroxymethylpterin dimethyltransferase